MSQSKQLSYYYQNREKQLEMRAKYYEENKEKIRERATIYFKEYYAKNRKDMLKRVADFAKENPEIRRKMQSDWREKNREHLRIYSKNRRDKIKELKIQEQNEEYLQQLKEYHEQKGKTKRCKEPQKPKEIKRGRPREKDIEPEIIIDRTVRFNLILDIEDVF